MARQQVQPVSMNAVPMSAGGVFPATPAVGIDAAGAGGSAFATAWAGLNGIMFYNSGQQFVWFVNGATACNAYLLIGAKAGGATPTYTTYTVPIAASARGWLPVLSPAGFNQQDQSAHSAAPGGAVGSAGVGLTCVDFDTPATMSVRVYQLAQVSP